MTTAATFALLTASANATLSTVRFAFNGVRFELTRFRAGRVELYEVDPSDGIAMFAGYLDEVGAHLPPLHARAVAQGLEALNEAHASFWAASLPGAETWSQPRF